MRGGTRMFAFFEPLFRCEPGEILRLTIFILGGLASLVSVAAALFRLYRRFMPRPPSKKERRVVTAVRAIANELVDVGEYAKAIRLYNATLVLHPNSAETHFRRGLAHLGDGRIENAQADWDRAVEILPTYER